MKVPFLILMLALFALVSFPQTGSPDAAARSLFEAWSSNDRAKAGKYAAPAVVRYIWKERVLEYEFENCDRYGGKTHCFYRHRSGGSLNLTMQRSGKIWKAVDVAFYLD